MAIGITIDIKPELKGYFVKDPIRSLSVFETEFSKALTESVLMLQSAIVPLIPLVSGSLRKSIIIQTLGRGLGLKGTVGTPSIYALPIEYGGRPHWPPEGPIRLWIQRKGISWTINGQPATLEQMVYILRRQIAYRGTRAFGMFEKAFTEQRSKILKIMDDAMEKVLTILRGE